MSAKLWEVGTSNAFSTQLNGNISAGDSSITLTTTAGLTAPGVICIDRVDSNGTATPSLREYVSFTGISTNTLTGCLRGLAGSSDQAHSSGAIAEENFSVTHWGEMLDFLQVSHDVAGNIVVSSTATIATLRVYTHLNASGASISGRFPITPTWFIDGAVSLATTSIAASTPMPQAGMFQFFSMCLKTPASGASLIVDINKNGTSIFEAATRLLIPGGGTLVSTASIASKFFNSGDVFTVDIDSGGGSGSGLFILGRAL